MEHVVAAYKVALRNLEAEASGETTKVTLVVVGDFWAATYVTPRRCWDTAKVSGYGGCSRL